jgi:hypothetical protein
MVDLDARIKSTIHQMTGTTETDLGHPIALPLTLMTAQQAGSPSTVTLMDLLRIAK